MINTSGKKFFDKFQNLKNHLKQSNIYYRVRDRIFFNEIKREKRIESKQDFELKKKYIEKWYKEMTGYELNLENPKTLTEKQQWLKLFDQNPLKNKCTDKIEVRKYIEKKIGAQYLVPLLENCGKKSFDNANEIDFDELPNQFVIACNHGSSMTIVVQDKSKLTKHKIKQIKANLNRWLKIEPAYIGAFDYVYKDIKPKIMITKFLTGKRGITCDYKILCFNGKPKYFWIDSDRFTSHKRKVYNLDKTDAKFNINKYEHSNEPLPSTFDKMIELASILCSDFLFVRVDFYEVDGKIYFGELTFNTGGGTELPYPIEYNEKLGNELSLPINNFLNN